MKCVICGTYYKKNIFNSSSNCEDCVDSIDKDLSFDDIDLINSVTNPSGKTLAVFSDEFDYNDISSFSS